MIKREVEYLKLRVRAESLRALEARLPAVADAHHVLAAAYAERLTQLEQGEARTS